MPAILLAGLVTGILISAPLGPMAALASLEVSRNRWPAAIAVAGGVCFGDILLAIATLFVLKVPTSISVPHWLPIALGTLVLIVFAGVIWKEADKPVQPANAQSFARAVIATLTHPGNTLGYIALYASTLTFFANRNVASLSVAEASILVTATCLGMVVGWAMVLGAVHMAVKRYGEIPARLQPTMARAVSLLMLATALLLAIKLFT